ncbi:hypothetical protein [Sphingomonas lenta]|uniref:Uncharacterized protein n=1 Tax=Sphingomonas lenta TaxID=1141887 RepID=A0A2A2SDS6_9SPHN|nr:hypothetical protein [Sphingomonas lenta]PAX07181.1 hypothetical protein CKY28_14175 [Sphingomonas lenta]
MRGLFFILGVVVLLTVAAMHFGYLRFGDGAPAATPDQGMTIEQEAERIAAEEPPANGAD